MRKRARRRWLARLLGALAAWPALAACACGPEADPLAQEPQRPTPVADSLMPDAIEQAYRLWHAVGVEPPEVQILPGNPPLMAGFRADGCCLCDPASPATSLIVVRYAIPTLIAHELGHAMGLRHVAQGAEEIMSPIVQPWAVIGPATLAELHRVRREQGGPPQ